MAHPNPPLASESFPRKLYKHDLAIGLLADISDFNLIALNLRAVNRNFLGAFNGWDSCDSL